MLRALILELVPHKPHGALELRFLGLELIVRASERTLVAAPLRLQVVTQLALDALGLRGCRGQFVLELRKLAVVLTLGAAQLLTQAGRLARRALGCLEPLAQLGGRLGLALGRHEPLAKLAGLPLGAVEPLAQ